MDFESQLLDLTQIMYDANALDYFLKLQDLELDKSMLCVIDSGCRFIHCDADDANIENVGSVLEMKISFTALKRSDFFISSKANFLRSNNIWDVDCHLSKVTQKCQK